MGLKMGNLVNGKTIDELSSTVIHEWKEGRYAAESQMFARLQVLINEALMAQDRATRNELNEQALTAGHHIDDLRKVIDRIGRAVAVGDEHDPTVTIRHIYDAVVRAREVAHRTYSKPQSLMDNNAEIWNRAITACVEKFDEMLLAGMESGKPPVWEVGFLSKLKV